MNTPVFFFSICLFACVTGCREASVDPVEPFDAFPGKVTANVNGEQWEGKTTYLNNNPGFLPFLQFNWNSADGFSPVLSLSQLRLRTDTMILFRDPVTQSFTFPTAQIWMGQGDIISGGYFLIEDDTIPDFLLFTRIDTVSMTVEGIFQASFAVDTSFIALTELSDTLVFREGVFETVLYE